MNGSHQHYPGEPGLEAECAAVASEFTGWNVYPSLSSAPGETYGDIYAAHVLTPAEQDAWQAGLADAVTLAAPTPDLMRHEIALWLHQASRRAA